MKFFRGGKTERKDNPTGKAIYLQNKYKTRELKAADYAREGYILNVIVFRCIHEIAKAMGSVEIEVWNKDNKPIDNHPALQLLAKPNPTESWAQFLRHAITDYLFSGNMFITSDKKDRSQPNELWAQSPLYMNVIAGTKGLPASYEFKNGTTTVPFPVDQIDGWSTCFHLKTYNPENPFVGLSPMAHVALSADVHNNGLKWNSSLLNNGARPSGIITFEDKPAVDILSAVKEWFKETLQGVDNAGEMPILVGGAGFQEMQMTAKEMDYLNLMKEMAKYVATAYGVPLPLIDNDASTFNNLESAKERLWTDTVLPLLNEFLQSFGNWLLPAYGKDLKFGYNVDSIPALEGVRAKRFTRMSDSIGKGMLTINEAREAIGYKPVVGGDELLIPSSLIPMGINSGDSQNDLTDISNPAIGKEKVSDIALNGAQVQALQQIVQAVADGLLPADTAIALCEIAFPSISREQIVAMISPAEDFEPDHSIEETLKAIGMTEKEIKALKKEAQIVKTSR